MKTESDRLSAPARGQLRGEQQVALALGDRRTLCAWWGRGGTRAMSDRGGAEGCLGTGEGVPASQARREGCHALTSGPKAP